MTHCSFCGSESPAMLKQEIDRLRAELLTANGAFAEVFAENDRLRAENERLRQASVVVKESWESLPAGNHGWRAIEQWLANPMKPAIDNLRSELAKTAKEGE